MKNKVVVSLFSTAVFCCCAASVSAAPQRTMNLQGVTYTVDTIAHYKAGPAMKYSRLAVRSENNTFGASVLEFDMKDENRPQIKVEVGRDSVNTAEGVTSIAQRKSDKDKRYVSAMNGDFFITSGFTANHPLGNRILGFPNTTCASLGKLIAPDAIDYGSREKCFIMTTDGNMFIDATDISLSYSYTGKTDNLRLSQINYVRSDNDVILYNSSFGGWTKTDDTGAEVALELQEGEKWRFNTPIRMKVVSLPTVSKGNSRIPANGAVLSAGKSAGTELEYVKNCKVGDEVVIRINLSLPKHGNIAPDNISEIVGGDVRILNQGNVTYYGDPDAIRFINTPTAKYQRSLIGFSEDRSKLVMCTVDGGIGGGGASYYDSADLMRELGCYDALDLDGGGSTLMYLRTPGIVNHLRDGSERAVGNGIFAVVNAPEDNTIREIRFADHAVELPQYASYKPVFYGYNGNGELISMDVEGVELTVPDGFGRVLSDGKTLFASGLGCHAISATYNGYTTSVAANIIPVSEIKVKYADIVIDNTRDWQVELTTDVNGTPMPLSAAAMSWISTDPSVATVSVDGYVKGIKNGSAIIRGTLGDIVAEVNLSVEIPSGKKMADTPHTQSANFTVTKSGISNGFAFKDIENGVRLDYRISSTRNAYFTLTGAEIPFFSLPDEFSFSVRGNVSSKVMVNILTHDGRTITSTIDNIPAEGGDINLKIADFADTKDMAAVYPLKLKNILVYPKTLKTGTDYFYEITSPALTYLNADDNAGVDGITEDNVDLNAPTEYFDITGRPVSSPVKGNFYIRRQGSRTAKIIF